MAWLVLGMLAPSGAATAQRPSPGSQDRRRRVLNELGQRASAERQRLLALPPAATEPLADAPVYPVHGSLSLRYRLRGTGDARDQDAVGLLAVDLGDPTSHRATGRFYGRGYLDLDGAERDSTLRGLDQSQDEDFDLRVYEAFVDLNRIGPLSHVRVGRQSVAETGEEIRFDGLRVHLDAVANLPLSATLYGGVPAHLFEASASGDSIGGIGVESRPWHGGRIRVDWISAEDRGADGDLRNHLLGTTLWQRIDEGTDLYARHTWLEGASRDVVLRARTAVAGIGVLVHYYELFTVQRRLVTEFDPLFQQTAEYRPFRQVGVVVDRAFGEHWTVAAGIDARRLSDRSDEGPFNREYERLFLSPRLTDLPVDGLSLGLTAELWDSSGEATRSLGADVEATLASGKKVATGTSYNLFKLDSLTGAERDHVRTWFGRLEYDATADLSFELRYDYERAELGEFHTLRLRSTCRF